MSAKKATKQTEAQKPLKRKDVQVEVTPTGKPEVKAQEMGRLILSPALATYRVLHATGKEFDTFNTIDVPSLVAELCDQADAVNSGDMSRLEKMLANQATSLQDLFARLTERAMAQSQMPNLEGFMRLALKAQNQCRSTIETLATIKNPPVIYAKQANISNGHQQINNGIRTSTRTHAQAGENLNQQNELLVDSNQTTAFNKVNSTISTNNIIRRKPKMGDSQGKEVA